MKLRQNVFVYGTLKRGFYNYDAVLARQPDAAFVAEGVTTERFPLFVDHYKIPELLPAYTAAIHAAYTPPGGGRDPALFRPWGGYEP
ncbi:gamma-glutamylaminecyclotransferase [Aureococcus anophagefferens]|nr:gamma-glutamylaminecyclotransferase [Aureococcus anophagefferens]